MSAGTSASSGSHIDWFFGYVRGWVAYRPDGTPRTASLFVDGSPVETAPAVHEFQGLSPADSKVGFYLFTVPENAKDGQLHELEVRETESGVTLAGYPIKLSFLSLEPVRGRLTEALGASRWCVDYIRNVDGRIALQGWVLPIASNAPALMADGRVIDEQIHGRDRIDIGHLFPYVVGARNSGFRAEFDQPSGENDIEISLSSQSVAQSYYIPLFEERYPLPDRERMQRVAGGVGDDEFRLGGYTLFRKLETVLQSLGYSGYGDFARILDWGCGSGRLTRYLLSTSSKIVGADVDQDNVQWCAENLPEGRFVAIPLNPPTEFHSGEFDLAIGNSVFTHLTEAAQFAWLGELSRIIRPGGVALMSILTAPDLLNVGAKNRDLEILFSEGFLDFGGDPRMGEFIEQASYYRSSFHTPDYVRARWSEYFDVSDVIENCSNNHQSLVVLRRR